jgi:hypothetical protein
MGILPRTACPVLAQTTGSRKHLYRANLVCDEGQDLREEVWVPLELLLSDYERGPLYVFDDDNQNIYSRAATFPIRETPLTLTTNAETLRHES